MQIFSNTNLKEQLLVHRKTSNPFILA